MGGVIAQWYNSAKMNHRFAGIPKDLQCCGWNPRLLSESRFFHPDLLAILMITT